MFRNFMLSSALLLGFWGCTHNKSVAPSQDSQDLTQDSFPGARIPAQQGATLPDQSQYTAFYETARQLDFTKPNVKLKMSSGGTSVYAVIEVDGKPIGAVLPENTATKISGEIAAFHLGRALGIGPLYQEGVYYYLTGANLEAFRGIIPDAPFSGKWKEQNRLSVLEQIRKSPQGIDTVFKKFGTKPVDYPGLVNAAANRFNGAHILQGSRTPFGQFLDCKGPQPSKSVVVTANKGTATEYEMATQLSSIFLIDALTQQWDRFSGGNLQTITENGKVRFAANDNGGTWSSSWTQRFLSIVSRFDRNVAQRILALDDFLNRRSSEFLGLRSETELAQALGIERFPSAMRAIKTSLSSVAAHIRANQDCFFE